MQNGGRPLHTNSTGNRTNTEDRRFADIIKEKPLKVTIRVLVPVKEHPKVSTRSCCGESVQGLDAGFRCQEICGILGDTLQVVEFNFLVLHRKVG